jgi:hypothetical protein
MQALNRPTSNGPKIMCAEGTKVGDHSHNRGTYYKCLLNHAEVHEGTAVVCISAALQSQTHCEIGCSSRLCRLIPCPKTKRKSEEEIRESRRQKNLRFRQKQKEQDEAALDVSGKTDA